MLTETKKKFIKFLIKCEVLKFGQFMTKSGRITPYFIDTGNFKTGKQLEILGNFYAKKINKFKNEIDEIFGPAYKGIPLVVCCSEALFRNYDFEVPYLFNRKEEKDHGEGGNFIGYKPKQNDSVAIIEDVLTAGTAINQVVPQLKNKFNVKINHLFIAVDRCEKINNSNKLAKNDLKSKFDIDVYAIVNIFDILTFIKNEHIFNNYLEKMQNYVNTYCLKQD